MTYVEQCQKAAVAHAAQVRDEGRIPCPVCKTHTVSYAIARNGFVWVGCSNPECPMTKERRAAQVPWGTERA